MRIRFTALILAGLLTLTGFALAQTDPTPTPDGQTRPIVPVFTPTPTIIPDEPRLAVCAAPTVEGFVPHLLRPGERLADLLIGAPFLSVTQLAALNCIDDPAHPPVGAVIWVPARPAEPTPEPGPVEAPARIEAFSAESDSIQNTDSVRFTWAATGARAYFHRCPTAAEDAPCPPPVDTAPLPLDHTTAPYGPFAYAGDQRFRLLVEGAGEPVVRDLLLTVACAHDSLAPAAADAPCPPGPPLAVFAVWQPFEGGVMLWFSDTHAIWVMTAVDAALTVYPDRYQEGIPDPTDAAPTGLHTPVRGFGLVWSELGGPEGPLGWALEPERGFDSARGAASESSYTVYVGGPDGRVYAVTHIPQIGFGRWVEVVPAQAE